MLNPLYPDPKNENRTQVFEAGVEYQKQNLREILNFLSLHPDIFYPKTKYDYETKFCEFFEYDNFFQIFERFNNMLGQYLASFMELNEEFGDQ